MQSFLISIFAIFVHLCHRKIIDQIMRIYRTEAAQSHTTPEHHIFTLPPLPLIKGEYDNTTKSITSFTAIAIVTITAPGIPKCITKKYRCILSFYSSKLCFSFKMIMKNSTIRHFHKKCQCMNTNTLWAHFASGEVYTTRLKLTSFWTSHSNFSFMWMFQIPTSELMGTLLT